MEDDLKNTQKKEDDLKKTQKMEDDLKKNGRQPQFLLAYNQSTKINLIGRDKIINSSSSQTNNY